MYYYLLQLKEDKAFGCFLLFERIISWCIVVGKEMLWWLLLSVSLGHRAWMCHNVPCNTKIHSHDTQRRYIMSTTARPKKNGLLHIQTLLQKLMFRSAYKLIYHKERHPYIPFRYAYIMLFFNVFLDKITMESEFPIIPIMQSIGITTE